MCKDGACIENSWVCDGKKDCNSGEDEDNCHESCLDTDFTCDSGHCIDKAFVCDGTPDCPADASDEAHCNATVKCKEHEVFCRSQVECVPAASLCDGLRDCQDGSDEDHCEGYTCSAGHFRCGNTTDCIPFIWRCDGVPNCLDGSDENCGDDIRSCQTFLCEDKSRCLEFRSVCDGIRDCNDQSDEANNCSIPCRQKRCSYACTRTDAGVTCVCPPGYVVQPDKDSLCQDVNECEAVEEGRAPRCSQHCINTRGSYLCSCANPYSLEPDRRSCRMRHPAPALLLSGTNDILMFSMRTQGSVLTTVQTNLTSVQDMEVDSSGRRVFWIDFVDRKIYYTKLTWERSLTDTPVYINVGLVSPRALSYDWRGDVLYVLDSFQGQIVACTVEGLACAVVLSSLSEKYPEDILVDPLHRRLYWLQNAAPRRVMMSDMDGGKVQVLVQVPASHLHHLVVDYPAECLYWVDTEQPTMYSLPLAVQNGTASLKRLRPQGMQQPRGLAVVEDRVVWAEGGSGLVVSANKWTGEELKREVRHDSRVTGLVVMHPALQPDAGESACWRAKCGKMCLESSAPQGFSCLCPPEMVLHSDGLTCKWEKSTPFLLVASDDTVIQIPAFNIGHVNLRQLSAPGLHGIKVMDVNPITQEVIIGALSEQGRPIVLHSSSVWSSAFDVSVIEDRADYLGLPLSMAVDWAGDQVYWLNGQRNTVEIFKIHGQDHSRLTFIGVQNMVDIAINVTQGLLFYCTWGEKPGITRCLLDGSNCSVLVDHGVQRPYRLLSFADRLYWTDQQLGVLTSVRHDGLDRATHIQSAEVFALHKLLYYQHQESESIRLYSLETMAAITEYHFPSLHIQDLVMLIPRQFDPKLPCGQNNGGCSDICASLPGYSRRCLCPLGKQLLPDQRTCQTVVQVCPGGQVLCRTSDTCVLKSDLCDGNVLCESVVEPVQCLPRMFITVEDKTECPQNHGCQHLCTPTQDGPLCTCDIGFSLAPDNTSCIDADECAVRNGNCSQLCTNTKGSYSCSCVEGYRLIGDKATCYSEDHDTAYLVLSMDSGFSLLEMDGERQYILALQASPPRFFDMAIHDDWRAYHDMKRQPLRNIPVVSTSFVWADQANEVKLSTTVSYVVRTTDMEVRALCVDQLTKNVYFIAVTKGQRHTLVVCDSGLQLCHNLRASDDWKPSALVLHPAKRTMYWLDGLSKTIGSAFMDGQGIRTVTGNIVFQNSAMTLCPVRERLYWLGELRDLTKPGSTIHTIRIDGSNRYMLESFPLKRFLSMDLFEGYLYLAEQRNSAVYKVSTFASRHVLTEMRTMDQPIHSVRVVRGIPRMVNPCVSESCSDMCVLSEAGAKCLCPHRVLFNTSRDGCRQGKSTTVSPLPLQPPTSTRGTPSPSTPVRQWSDNRPWYVKSPRPLPASTTGRSPAAPSLELCLHYCLNQAFCQLINGRPHCSCPYGFSGTRCEVPVPKDTTTEPLGTDVTKTWSGGNATHMAPHHQDSQGAVTGVVVAVLLIFLALAFIILALYCRKRRQDKNSYAGVEFSMESDEASLVPGAGHDDFYYKFDVDGSLLDSSGSSSDSAVYSSTHSPSHIYNPTVYSPVYNPIYMAEYPSRC